MSELTDRIMSEIESDPRLDAKAISLDVQPQGLFNRRKLLKINGIVESAAHRDRILQIVKKQTGNRCTIADQLVVG